MWLLLICSLVSAQSCSPGWYLNSSGLCQQCGDKCVSCDDYTGRCQQCESWYSLSGYENYNRCIKCSPSCLSCGVAYGCKLCVDGYWKARPGNEEFFSCFECNPNFCSYCTNDQCICKEQYAPYPNNYYSQGPCILCRPGCKKCSTGDSYCMECYPGFVLNNGNCCLQSSNCQYCDRNSKCTSCLQNYYLGGGTCNFCFDGRCSMCSGNTCVKCASDSLYLDNFICNDCSAVGCLTCKSSTECTSCHNGKYLLSGSCKSCSSSCLTCSVSSNNCTSCASDKKLVNNKCCPLGCTGCDDLGKCLGCEINYFFTNDSSCIACPSTCKRCEYGLCICDPYQKLNKASLVSGELELENLNSISNGDSEEKNSDESESKIWIFGLVFLGIGLILSFFVSRKIKEKRVQSESSIKTELLSSIQ